MYLEKARKILESEYRLRKEENIKKFHVETMDEKIRHSYQVLGVGNFLLKHEKCFSFCSGEEKELFQAALLLHDVARFYEILRLGYGEHIDHGVYGAQMLEKIPEFNVPEIILAVRHHGHLIDALYGDKEYQALSSDKQEKVKKVAFLVRDADKLANFYLLVTNFEKMEPLFFVESAFKTPYEKNISEKEMEDFYAHRTVNRLSISNFAGWALGFMSWVFDLNYDYSFVFMKKHKIVEKLERSFLMYWKESDYKLICNEMENFLKVRG